MHRSLSTNEERGLSQVLPYSFCSLYCCDRAATGGYDAACITHSGRGSFDYTHAGNMRELSRHFCYHHCTMVTLNAHFDGTVIVPDEPLALEPNQRLRISIEPIDATIGDPAGAPHKVDLSKLLSLGLKSPTNPYPRFPDEDSLWEGTSGNRLKHGPNKPRR